MKGIKKVISVLICALLIFGTVAVGGGGFAKLFDAISIKASAEDATSGTCGANVTWSYNTSTKALTISGTGAMSGYSGSSYNGVYVTTAPWQPYNDTM